MSSSQPLPGSTQPLGRRIPQRAWLVINSFMRVLLGLPFPTPLGKRLMLVNVTGRKTGRRYRQPVSYVRHNGTLLTPGGGNWKRNLVPGRPVLLRINGHHQTATPEIVTDPDTTADLLAAMITANPAVSRFSGIRPDASGRPDPGQLHQALSHGFAIIRWHLQEADC